MKRWLVVFAVALISALMVWGVLRDPRLSRRNVDVPTDELLAYDLLPPHSIVLGIPPKSEELRITTWCVVGKATLEQRFDYQLTAEWRDSRDRVLQTHPLAFQSRVSLTPEGSSATAWATRLAYASDAVTDSRTLRLAVPKFNGGTPAKLRLAAMPGANSRILLRATFAEPRMPLEIRALDEAMTLPERGSLVENIASVSFDRLPWSLRQTALGAWQRRLDAAGIEGRDYVVTRLLVGSGRGPTGLVTAQRQPYFVHQRHALAYNVKGPLTVSVKAPVGKRVSLSLDGEAEPQLLKLGESGETTLSLPHRGFPYTVVVTSDSTEPVPIAISTTEPTVNATFGNLSRLPNDSRFELLPMVRRSTYYTAHPSKPVTVAIPKGQPMLGLRVRGKSAAPRGWLEATFGGLKSRVDVALLPSLFEQWSDDSPATDAQTLYLPLPEGVTEVTLLGSPELLLQPFTSDPEITESRLAPEYDVLLSPSSRWQYAKFDLERDVPLRPVELSQLTAEARLLSLLSQSRIVTAGNAPVAPDTLLVPLESTPKRHLLTPYVPARGRPPPTELTVALDRPRQVTIPVAGPLAGRAIVHYRVDAPRAEQTFELLVDGVSRLREEVLTQAADHQLALPSGSHLLEAKGLLPGDRVLVDAIPVTQEGAYRRRVVHRLDRGRSLSFRVQKNSPKLSLYVTCFVEGERLLAFDWRLVTEKRTAMAQSFTKTEASVSALTTPADDSWFWETRTHGALRQYRERIALGDDVPNGTITLQLRSQPSTPTLYLYAVVVGEGGSDHVNAPRFWISETPE